MRHGKDTAPTKIRVSPVQVYWILSIDADEIADAELINALHELILDDPKIVYDIKFQSYYGQKLIRFGSWGRDHHIRLFNRKLVRWSESPVHETLILPETVSIKKLGGHLHHYSVSDAAEFMEQSRPLCPVLAPVNT